MASVKDPRNKSGRASGGGIPPPSIATTPRPGIPSVEELVASGEFENSLTASFARALRVAIADHQARAAVRNRKGRPSRSQ